MERVTELMKRSAHFIMSQQGRFTCRRFRDVQMIGNDRFGCEQVALLNVGIHPRASTLGRPCIIIGEKQCERFAVGIVNFKHAHIGLVHREIVSFLEGEAVEFPRGEGRFMGAAQLKAPLRLHACRDSRGVLRLDLGRAKFQTFR